MQVFNAGGAKTGAQQDFELLASVWLRLSTDERQQIMQIVHTSENRQGITPIGNER